MLVPTVEQIRTMVAAMPTSSVIDRDNRALVALTMMAMSCLPVSSGNAGRMPIRKVFKQACSAAGRPDFTPHSLRHTLAQLADDFYPGPGTMKAWSQNLGHNDVLMTFTSYGTVPSHKQRQMILRMAQNDLTKSSKHVTAA